jgi:hypothetical protein
VDETINVFKLYRRSVPGDEDKYIGEDNGLREIDFFGIYYYLLLTFYDDFAVCFSF